MKNLKRLLKREKLILESLRDRASYVTDEQEKMFIRSEIYACELNIKQLLDELRR